MKSGGKKNVTQAIVYAHVVVHPGYFVCIHVHNYNHNYVIIE